MAEKRRAMPCLIQRLQIRVDRQTYVDGLHYKHQEKSPKNKAISMAAKASIKVFGKVSEIMLATDISLRTNEDLK